MDAGPAGLAPLCGVFVDVDRVEPAEYRHDPIVITGRRPDDEERVPAPEPETSAYMWESWSGQEI
jgi:hypothetical protein